MICPTCRGRGFVPAGTERADDLVEMKPCPDCLGGIASCCDAAGSSQLFRCAACFALQKHATIKCEVCRAPLVFKLELPETGPYRDDAFPERLCDRCAALYRGPAVYCSLECAVADA